MNRHGTRYSPLLTAQTRRLANAALRSWVGLGLLALAFVPAARESSDLFGWMPFWLLGAPVLVLAQMEAISGFHTTARMLARSRAVVRRTRGRPQARRLPQRRRLLSPDIS